MVIDDVPTRSRILHDHFYEAVVLERDGHFGGVAVAPKDGPDAVFGVADSALADQRCKYDHVLGRQILSHSRF
jgi:hypothetical protein